MNLRPQPASAPAGSPSQQHDGRCRRKGRSLRICTGIRTRPHLSMVMTAPIMASSIQWLAALGAGDRGRVDVTPGFALPCRGRISSRAQSLHEGRASLPGPRPRPPKESSLHSGSSYGHVTWSFACFSTLDGPCPRIAPLLGVLPPHFGATLPLGEEAPGRQQHVTWARCRATTGHRSSPPDRRNLRHPPGRALPSCASARKRGCSRATRQDSSRILPFTLTVAAASTPSPGPHAKHAPTTRSFMGFEPLVTARRRLLGLPASIRPACSSRGAPPVGPKPVP